MMQKNKNYYQILGVTKTATDEEIKRRYRQLVRQHHPDVAQDKEAAKLIFLEIAEAYQTLINPNRRTIYDASIDTQPFRTAPSARPSPGSRPPGSQQTQASARPRPSQTNTQTQQAQRARVAAEVQRLMSEAQKSFSSGQFRSAAYTCKEVIRISPRNFRAHVILGDIYRIQGQIDEAIAMYSVAVQLDPKNLDVQAKLDRLVRATTRQVADTPEDAERHASLKIGLSLIGIAIIGCLLFYLGTSPGRPIEEIPTWMGSWSPMLIQTLVYCSLVIGFLMSYNGQVERLGDELAFKAARRSDYPVGLLLMLFTFISFYIAAGVYILSGWLQESLSKSVMKAYGAAIILILIVASAYQPGRGEVLLLGGNIAFPSILIGWSIGDLFK